MAITRRTFLHATAAATLVNEALAAQAPGRPNILFCIADDWGFPHASIYGDPVVKTPNFDRIAKEGVLFTNAFTAAPTCSPSRAGILTGQPPHKLDDAGNLWSVLKPKFKTYTDLLAAAGYHVGSQGKGFSPGANTGRPHNAAGKPSRSFDAFLDARPEGAPFCFWFGSTDPHRPYQAPLRGTFANLKPDDVRVPPYLPDSPVTREDFLDYYAEVQRFDAEVGELLKLLDERGLAQNTLVVMTSDNGSPFPRAKANLYDAGTHMPLAIRWPAKIVRPGRTSDALVSHVDFAPTFLQAAGHPIPAEVNGASLFDVLEEDQPKDRSAVFPERERHANVRAGNVGYPCRSVRTRTHLYIRNFRPDRWPAGDPGVSKVQGIYGDIDAGPTKKLLISDTESELFKLACAKRPAEELYELADDPHQLKNVAADPACADVLKDLRARLADWMTKTNDPRATEDTDVFDTYPYLGGR